MDRTARSSGDAREEIPQGHGEASGEAAPTSRAKRAVARPFHAAESVLLRLGLRPGAAWALAWIFVFSGGLVFDPSRSAVEAVAACVCGALFGGLTWVGALGFAGSMTSLAGLGHDATRGAAPPPAARRGATGERR